MTESHVVRRPVAGVTRRRHMALLGGSAAAGALSACQRGSSAPVGGESRPSTAAVSGKLLWQIRSGATYESLAREMLAVFKQQQPNVTVEYVQGSEGNRDKMLTMMLAGEGPDVIQNWPPGVWELSSEGHIQNINDYTRDLKKADIDDFVTYRWETVQIPTTSFRYGLPTYVDMDVLFYNKTLFKQRGAAEPTADWGRNEYAAALKQMTFADSNGAKVYGGFKPAHSFVRGQNMITMFGGNVVDPKDLTRSQLDSAPAQQGLEWARARVHDDQTWAPLDAAKRDWQPNSPREGFLQGRIAMFEEGMYQLQVVAERMQVEWDIQHVPKGPAKRTALGDTDAWSMWKNSKSKDAAWQLLKFITSREYSSTMRSRRRSSCSSPPASRRWTRGSRRLVGGSQCWRRSI